MNTSGGGGGGGLIERGLINFPPVKRGGAYLRGGLIEDLLYYRLTLIKNNRRMLIRMAERWPRRLYRCGCLKGVLVIYPHNHNSFGTFNNNNNNKNN